MTTLPCPRPGCKGKLLLEGDRWGPYLDCYSCGYHREIDLVVLDRPRSGVRVITSSKMKKAQREVTTARGI